MVPFLANQYASTQKWKWTRNDPKRSASMAVTLNRQAYEHAEELIEEGTFVFDERDARSEHQPSAQEQK